jgi:hypothetical protein
LDVNLKLCVIENGVWVGFVQTELYKRLKIVKGGGEEGEEGYL